MKVVGLCKTFSCGDFLPAVLDIIYPFMDKIVFVNSTINWLGEIGDNECKPFINSYNDQENKIINLDCQLSSQKQQYDLGYQYIKEKLNADWIFIFDTDEIWDSVSLETVLTEAKNTDFINGIAVKMYTYIKSPLFRIEPEEPCSPCVMVRPVFKTLQGIRGNATRPMTFLPDVKFHHFSYVRKSEEQVFSKVKTSIVGDCEDVHNLENTDLQLWKINKWDKLPNIKNFHTTKTYEAAWKKIKIIDKKELPVAVQDLPVINQLIKESQK